MSVKKLIKQLLGKYEGNEKLPELRQDQVMNIIESVFEDYELKSGSHIKITDSRIKNYWELTKDRDLGPDGSLCIPVKKGQKVRAVYIKDLVKFIKVIRMMEGKSEEQD
jgi:hypothetical protein